MMSALLVNDTSRAGALTTELWDVAVRAQIKLSVGLKQLTDVRIEGLKS